MVGVPGRSKACHTCKQRRIKCGSELPTCRNCSKSKRVCTGYQRQHAFILSQLSMNKNGRTHSNDQSVLRSQPDSGVVMISRWRADKSKPSPRVARKIAMMPETAAMLVRLPREVSTQQAYRSRFISLMFEKDGPVSGEMSRAYQTFGDRYAWSTHILNLPSLTPALESALLAMSTARLGRHTGRPALVQESLKLYTQSVARVRRDVLDQSARNSEQSLAACLSLLWYEAIECPGKTMDGYQAHYRGCLELLQMRGPEAYTSGLAHCTLQILRLHTVVLGNGSSGATFLAQPEWLDLPWSSQPDTKSFFDQLLDTLLQLPSLEAQMQTFHAAVDPHRKLRCACSIVEESQKTEDALQGWLGSFRAALPGDGALYRAELSRIESVVDNAVEGKLFPVAFLFPAFMVGQALVHYWVALMSVHARLCHIYSSLRGLTATLDLLGREKLPCTCECSGRSGCCENKTGGPSPEPEDSGKPKTATASRATHCLRHFNPDRLPHLERQAEWPRMIAYNVCQSAEYFLLDTNRGFGPASVLPALEWVREFWQRAPGSWARGVAWIDDMVGRIHSSGYGIAGALLKQRRFEGSQAGA